MAVKTNIKKKDDRQAMVRMPRAKKVCLFCTEKKEPSFTDSVILRKFMSDRAKIQPRLRTGACSKHQRRLTTQIKYARHLSLLPFSAKV